MVLTSPVRIEVGVGDHGALQVEPPVPEVDEALAVLSMTAVTACMIA